jgi:hypothetical protein
LAACRTARNRQTGMGQYAHDDVGLMRTYVLGVDHSERTGERSAVDQEVEVDV